ncbi:pullulanase [Streptococcus dysgalactiae subsp. equisimilis]|uniref:pullulanase n=1 Tax=Streptococcus dysgalactiae subsp. equisimilis TaxID=119602 RepID=A0A9X8XGU2_STREQ|nr:pullulanase [Streptococcus dysgalactiae]SUN61482.1 pullulanase [Streptococcus dysgalactiae subsp. equisimilis]
MIKRVTQGSKQYKYAIKKLSIGVVSVATGASILLYSPQVMAQESSPETGVTQTQVEHEKQATEQADSVVNEAVNASAGLTPESSEKRTEAVGDSSQATEPQLSTNQADASQADKISESAKPLATDAAAKSPAISDNHLRMHFKTLPAGESLGSLGLWVWGDVDQPSKDWPNGAITMTKAKKDDYGYYLDVPLAAKHRQQVSYLINNKAGENLSKDQHISLFTPRMNEVWIDENYHAHAYRPLKKGYLRINYHNQSGHYDNLAVWTFKDVKTPTTDWPNGLDLSHKGPHGAYVDVPLKEGAKEIGFLILDKSKSGDAIKVQPKDYLFKDLDNHTQIFVKDTDPKVYNNPYYIDQVSLKGAEQTTPNEIKAIFTTLDGLDEDTVKQKIKITDKAGKAVAIDELILDKDKSVMTLKGDFKAQGAVYTVTFGEVSQVARQSWQLKDKLYAYDGELGATLAKDGSVDLALWSPSADSVKVVVYDKQDQTKVVGQADLTKSDKGVWRTHLTSDSIKGISDYTGYYYLYEITRGQEKVMVLDPYAKSLAAWNNATANDQIKTAKAAFVNPSLAGPKDLDFAKINNFKKREDAIIYEAHVRDFTSDPSLDGKLRNEFGTFAAFIEKLDYLKELGVTHVQLLPVLSYFYVNELDKSRSTAYTSSDNNYNWGYDPQHYFALSGMYSANPNDPALRIAELKQLVNEIHKRGMGVIFDVVYNHTARTYLFEDLEPNYYHFMNADGTARESFGGGRLGTTHAMSRRILVDSITYLTREFKVDGFRFDMMGDHDAAAIEQAFKAAKAINPNTIMIGEGWRTYQGDEGKKETAADQDWMKATNTVGVFSDDIRNTLKSGFPNEGTAAFITGGAKNLEGLFKTIKAQPSNFEADAPGDVVQYIAAHDNLTLHDVIAKSINKDPKVAEEEIHKRIRLGNTLILTAQGTAFIHSGQEYGRTKHLLNPDYKTKVADDKVPNKATLIDAVAQYPYFIHDSYDSSDAVNHFDWAKATDGQANPISYQTQAYTKGLIALRRSSDAFRKASMADVNRDVTLITQAGQGDIQKDDLIIGYQTIASNGDRYAVFVNADSKARTVVLPDRYRHLLGAQVLVDAEQAGVAAIAKPKGVQFTKEGLTIDGLTAIVLKVAAGAVEAPSQTQQARSEQSVRPVSTTVSKASPLMTPDQKPQQASLPQTGEMTSKGLLATGMTMLIAVFGLFTKRQKD